MPQLPNVEQLLTDYQDLGELEEMGGTLGALG